MISNNKSLWQLVTLLRKTRPRANIVWIFYDDILLKINFLRNAFLQNICIRHLYPKAMIHHSNGGKVNFGYWVFLSSKCFGCSGAKNRSATHVVIHKSTCNYIVLFQLFVVRNSRKTKKSPQIWYSVPQFYQALRFIKRDFKCVH